MDCPRCGARLARISLGDRRSVYCEECRFADIESDHTRVSDGEETWDDALRRFRTAHAGETDDAGSDGVGDDAGLPVETVDGIGPVYTDQLDAGGVTTLTDLAEADAGDVAERVDAPESTVADWIEQARRIVSSTVADGTDSQTADDTDSQSADDTDSQSADDTDSQSADDTDA